MRKPERRRSIAGPLFSAAVCVSLMLHAAAAGGAAPVEHLVGKVAGTPTQEQSRIDIYVERWSTDEELERIRVPLAEGDHAKALAALQQQPRAGVVLMPGGRYGSAARARTPRRLLFAREVLIEGRRQVIVVSDEQLDPGESNRTGRRPTGFHVIDIRFGPDGTGIGKIAADDHVALTATATLLEIRNYSTRPVRITDVRPEKP